MSQAVVSVTGPDKPGIISGITGILSRSCVNLEDITMTILEGEFAMIMIVDAGNLKKSKESRETLEKYGQKEKLSIHWRDARRKLRSGKKHGDHMMPFIITVAGTDKTGIVYAVSRALSKQGLNITDLNSKIVGASGRRKGIYVLMLEVDVPKRKSVKSLERSLKRLGKRIKVDIQMRPVMKVDF